MLLWVPFLLAFLSCIVILYFPGFLLSRILRFSILDTFAFAPCVSIVGYSITFIIFEKIGIEASWISVFLIPSLLMFLIWSVIKLNSKNETIDNMSARAVHGDCCDADIRDLLLLVFYIGVAILVCTLLFLESLDNPDAFSKAADNTWHLSLIRSFVDSGDMSTLSASIYRDAANAGEGFYSASGFYYPSVLHALAALVVTMVHCSVPSALNACLTVFISVVFPTSLYMFMRTMFYDRWVVRIAGGVVSMAFAAFPWEFLVFGPLYPNLAGLCLVPLGCSAFIKLIKEGRCFFGFRLKLFVMFFFSFAAAGLVHANSVFSMAVLMFPACLSGVYSSYKRFLNVRGVEGIAATIRSGFISVFFCAASALIWILLRNLSFFNAIVNFHWDSYSTPSQQLVSILTLAYREPEMQPVLALFVIIGIVLIFRQHRNRWLVGSYVLAATFLFVNATTDGSLKSVLTGYWYSDPYRVAATVALAGIPLASVGLGGLIDLSISPRWQACGVSFWRTFIRTALVLICFSFFVFQPFDWSAGADMERSAFSQMKNDMDVAYDSFRPNTIDPAEIEFSRKVSEIVDPDYKILNNADDGSAFAYPLFDLNLCYRRSDSSGDGVYGKLLRKKIDQFSYNQEVQDAVKRAGIKYLLILDQGGKPLMDRCYYGYYKPSTWSGQNRVTDSTPGFKLLLSEGDMRLYEIEPFE